MTRYSVNASITFGAWYDIEADSPEEALDLARSASPRDFEYDDSTGEVDFNVEPAVEVVS